MVKRRISPKESVMHSSHLLAAAARWRSNRSRSTVDRTPS